MVTENANQSETFIPVADLQSIDELFRHSKIGPVVFFKHSLTCPISSAAYNEMQRLSKPVSLIVIQQARDVSREIETRTGIRHESPQVIIVRNGAAVWNSSHWNIKADTVERAVDAAE